MQEASIYGDDLLLPGQAFRNDYTGGYDAADMDVTALDLIAACHYVYVRPIGVGHDGCLRHDRPLRPGERDTGPCERARPQPGIGAEGDAHLPETGLRIDDGAEEPDVARERTRIADHVDVSRLAHLQVGEILLGHLTDHLHLPGVFELKQRRAAGACDLTDLCIACQDHAVDGRHDACQRELRAHHREL